MKTGTHISIPTKYDLLLNQEIILLSEIKKISKNELINSIYFADFTYAINYLNIHPKQFKFEPLNRDTYYNLINPIIESNLFHPDIKDYKKVSWIAKVGLTQCKGISDKISSEYKKQMQKEIQLYLNSEQHKMYNMLFTSISFIPNIEGTSRIYIRCEKGTIDKKELAVKLETYFKLPLALRELYIFINDPIIKELLDEINNPKTNRKVSLKHKNSLIPSQKHSYFKIEEGATIKYLDLNNKKLDRKDILSSKKNNIFITKKIAVTDDDLFFECLKYFVNKIFLISNENNIFTITGTERDIFIFEKMIH